MYTNFETKHRIKTLNVRYAKIRRTWDAAIKNSWGVPLFLALISGCSNLELPLAAQGPALELYGTFHAMGLAASIAATDDPNQNTTASVEYRQGNEPYRAGFPLTRTGSTRFVGSLFWLQPGTVYDVRVTFNDPDGGPLNNIILYAKASTRAEIYIPVPNRTLYVSPTGSGTACSLISPCSLAMGIGRARPGDEVALRGGVYYQGELSLPRSGAPGAPILIRGYGQEKAVLDGADPATRTWTAAGNGLYHTTTTIQDIGLVAANGFRLYPYNNLADLQSLSWGLPGFFAQGNNLYVHLAGNANPNQAQIIVSRYNRGFDVERDYIYFVNLTFRHYGQGSEARAIRFKNASHNLVHGSTFALNNGGVTIRDLSHRNVIQNNVFYDTISGWPWDSVKATGLLERGGVYFGGSSSGRGNVIRRNIFHGFFDGFDVCGGEPVTQTNETDVYGNLVYNIGDDGAQVDGWCSNVRLWDNTFHDVLVGISFAPIVEGPVYAIRNLIYRFGVGNTDHIGDSFKFNSSSSDRSGSIYIIHNTAVAALPDSSGLDLNNGSSSGWELVYSRNNIWSGLNYALRNRSTGQPVDLDNDNLWNGQNDDLVRWGDTTYTALADFAQATGHEVNGLNVEPGFVSPPNGNYTLKPTSSLIDAGVIIPGINHNYNGAAPDIGAFELNGGASGLTRWIYLPVVAKH